MDSLFRGFSDEAPRFLEENHVRDDKSWFEVNRIKYNDLLLSPFKNLVTDLSETITSIDPALDTKASVGRTISKIYRDTRFAKNKSLFHSAMWITFKRREEGWQSAPAFFFEITPELWRYGMGFFAPSRETMDNYREVIDEDPKSFLKMVTTLNTKVKFGIYGDVYKRPLKAAIIPELDTWYNRKGLYLSYSESGFAALSNEGLIDLIKKGFSALSPLYDLMRKAAEKSITESKNKVRRNKK